MCQAILFMRNGVLVPILLLLIASEEVMLQVNLFLHDHHMERLQLQHVFDMDLLGGLLLLLEELKLLHRRLLLLLQIILSMHSGISEVLRYLLIANEEII